MSQSTSRRGGNLGGAVGDRDPNAVTATDAGEKQHIEKLVRSDRENLRRFAENLSRGLTVDDMEPDLKAWWSLRY